MTFANRLKSVAWETLYHSYGTAADVPDLIMGLLSPKKKTRDYSRDYLLYSLDHQGVQRWESTAKAVPFLLELLQNPETPDRHLLIPLLTDFAVGNADGYYLITGFHIDQCCLAEGTKEYGYFVFRENKGSPADLAYGQMLRDIYDEVKKGLPLYLQLVKDKGSRMRVFAPHVLGWLTDVAAESVPVLLEQYKREKHPAARASQVLALSYATTFDAGLREMWRPTLEAAFKLTKDLRERRTLAVALLRAGFLSADVQKVLLDALMNPLEKSLGYRLYPWVYAEHNDVLLDLLFHHAPEDWKEQTVHAICDGLSRITNEHSALELATILMRETFQMPPEDERPQWYDAYRPVEWETLNDLQKHVLKTFVETPLVWHFGNINLLLNDYGLPPYQDRMAKFVAGEGDVMRFKYREEHLLPADFFTRLNAINWREHKHVYGTAVDLPDMVRALLSPDAETRKTALEKITKSLVHGYPGRPRQGVSLVVIPFLLEMLATPAVPDRHRLMALLADIAVEGAQSPRVSGYESEYYYYIHGFDVDRNYTPEGSLERGWPVFQNSQVSSKGSPEDLAYGQQARAIYEKVQENLPLFLSFVDHPEIPFRVFAPFLLAWLNGETVEMRLLEQFTKEVSPLARASQALALAYNKSQSKNWFGQIEMGLKNVTDTIERHMLSIALIKGGYAPDEARIMLCAALEKDNPTFVEYEQFPWARLQDNNFLLDFLLTAAPPAWRPDVIKAVLNYLCTSTDKDGTEDTAETLLRHTFRNLDIEERFEIVDQGRQPELKLTEERLVVLQTLVDTDIFWNDDGYPHLPLLGYGVPGYRDEVREMLLNHQDTKKHNDF